MIPGLMPHYACKAFKNSLLTHISDYSSTIRRLQLEEVHKVLKNITAVLSSNYETLMLNNEISIF